jgi:hypothetical protein
VNCFFVPEFSKDFQSLVVHNVPGFGIKTAFVQVLLVDYVTWNDREACQPGSGDTMTACPRKIVGHSLNHEEGPALPPVFFYVGTQLIQKLRTSHVVERRNLRKSDRTHQKMGMSPEHSLARRTSPIRFWQPVKGVRRTRAFAKGTFRTFESGTGREIQNPPGGLRTCPALSAKHRLLFREF